MIWKCVQMVMQECKCINGRMFYEQLWQEGLEL